MSLSFYVWFEFLICFSLVIYIGLFDSGFLRVSVHLAIQAIKIIEKLEIVSENMAPNVPKYNCFSNKKWGHKQVI